MSSSKESYRNVLPGALKLKRAAPVVAVIDKKKKRKKSKRKKKKAKLDQELEAFLKAKEEEQKRHGQTAVGGTPEEAEEEEDTTDSEDMMMRRRRDTRTKAERQFDEAQQELEEELIRKRIAKTHRQRIEEFNQYLSQLSEHHDIPKVGPG